MYKIPGFISNVIYLPKTRLRLLNKSHTEGIIPAGCHWNVYPCRSNADGTVSFCKEWVCTPDPEPRPKFPRPKDIPTYI